MNRQFDYTEQIENYLEGKMSGEEMKEFDLRLQNDPALRSEFQLQQDMINALKANRKAELKARLDKVNVGSYGSSLTGLKIALGVALTAAVGLSVYFFTEQKALEKEKVELAQQEQAIQKVQEEEVVIPEGEPATIEDDVDKEILDIPVSPKPEAERTDKANNLSNSSKTAEKVSAEGTTAKVTRPKAVEEFESVEEKETEIKVPENNLVEETPHKELTAVEVESKEDNSHTFHYKFYNNKLYLYGDFKNIPYEIIELNTISGKSLYLYYKNSFYYLESNQMEVSPLKEIKDQKLIEELDSLRVKK